jgi:hypothetical protein
MGFVMGLGALESVQEYLTAPYAPELQYVDGAPREHK